MANADSLKGKEYIDYLLQFLKGKKDGAPAGASQAKKKSLRKQVCFHELKADECQKLRKTLDDEQLLYYFNVNDGFTILVDSLYESTTALKLIQSILEKNKKLQDDF